tara:strand:- start:5078 stop:5689 length:612 start_codon:yes stop_codon:yes gene_type:complete
MIIINFKTYKQGSEVLALAKKIAKVNKKAILCVQPTSISIVSRSIKNPIYAQHVDFQKPGRNTGFIIPETVKAVGAKGTLLNHSEHPLSFKTIKETIQHCNKIKLKTIVFSPSIAHTKKIMKLKPYAIAYEDPKLVASGNSITKYKIKNVEAFAKLLKTSKIISICGAGISSKEDIKEAKKLGCQGVALSSAITKKEKVNIIK